MLPYAKAHQNQNGDHQMPKSHFNRLMLVQSQASTHANVRFISCLRQVLNVFFTRP